MWPDQLAVGVAEHPVGRGALVGHRCLAVQQQDRVGGVLHQGAEPRLALPDVQVVGERHRLQRQRELRDQGLDGVDRAGLQRLRDDQDDDGEQLAVHPHREDPQLPVDVTQPETGHDVEVELVERRPSGTPCRHRRTAAGWEPASGRVPGRRGGRRRRPPRPRRAR